MTDWLGWTELVVEELLLVAAFLVMFDGVRRLVRDGMSRGASSLVSPATLRRAQAQVVRLITVVAGH